MSERITTDGGLTIGLDLGDRWTEGRVLDPTGEFVEAFRVRTTESALSSRLAGFPASRVVLEAGTHSPWVSRSPRSAEPGAGSPPRPRGPTSTPHMTRRATESTRSCWLDWPRRSLAAERSCTEASRLSGTEFGSRGATGSCGPGPPRTDAP